MESSYNVPQTVFQTGQQGITECFDEFRSLFIIVVNFLPLNTLIGQDVFRGLTFSFIFLSSMKFVWVTNIICNSVLPIKLYSNPKL